ncbi:OFA family MFS transporter [Ammoniphilus sp. YIM 78166]|uniref:L-lactate MFS transporter n=1 Tax=Ammoniphilus sp. YIM 78166 TaxID=1644106 RepID=UPI00107057E0|nr:OFA family MFS transporter [Ammoniphilus sp. YIM 78166]
MGKTKNRWLIALSAIAIHLSIGSAYAYSVFKKPIENSMGWSGTEIALAFTLALICLGLSAAVFGRFVEKYGPSKSAMVSAVLFSTGQIGSGFAIAQESLTMFLILYGVVGGMGLGIGYISPVSTLVKWFPDRRGLATGMAVFGFGAGALITGPIAADMIADFGISSTFYTLGIAYFILMMLGASYIARPPEGWMLEGMKTGLASGKAGVNQDLAQLTANEAVKTKRFWLLWVMILINISAGLMIISVASPMGQEMVGMEVAAAAAMVGIMGIFNGAGRIGWAGISDYIGRSNVFAVFFSIQIIAFLIIPNVTNAVAFQALILIVMTCYGGGFASLPAFIGDMFGTKQLGAIHGYILTAWSMAGVVGPIIVARMKEATGSYVPAFYIFAALLAVALVVTYFIKQDINKIRKQQASQQKVA